MASRSYQLPEEPPPPKLPPPPENPPPPLLQPPPPELHVERPLRLLPDGTT